MPRYITRAAKPLYVETPLWGDVEPHRPSLSVDGHEPVFTGILDAKGEEIWRAPNPMGFARDKEW